MVEKRRGGFGPRAGKACVFGIHVFIVASIALPRRAQLLFRVMIGIVVNLFLYNPLSG